MKKKFVLKKNEDFKRLIDHKVFFVNKSFSIYVAPNELGYSRFGISVGKKHGNAVRRNQIKRQIRMMIDQEFPFSVSNDYLIMVRKDYHKLKFNENFAAIQKLHQKIKARGVMKKWNI
ncbi:ribonuclease P protein component [Mycoplasma sp. P36-A1]|uniref:ribonuclease P protein component n=1 Tax=Mycoplasma sp. P36-A1 TaxID=3252900 RepID=UPI003C3056E2